MAMDWNQALRETLLTDAAPCNGITRTAAPVPGRNNGTPPQAALPPASGWSWATRGDWPPGFALARAR